MERVVATIHAENKYEAIAALMTLYDKVKEYGPSEKIVHEVVIDDLELIEYESKGE